MAGVAITSEVLALIPPRNKSLSSAINVSLFNWAVALSGLFVSRSIGWKLFAPEWMLFGQTFTVYDTLLLIFATMIVLLLLTIGLIPKVKGMSAV